MTVIAFRPYKGSDREERLESDATQTALAQLLGDRLTVTDEFPKGVTHAFGRTNIRSLALQAYAYPAGHYADLPYWEWAAFQKYSGRTYDVLDLSDASRKVAELHRSGNAAFVKSTRTKELAIPVRPGATLIQQLDGMEYALCDRGPCLIVQEHVDMQYEYRMFVIGGAPITGAGCIEQFTPEDNVDIFDDAVRPFRTADCPAENRPDIVRQYLEFASQVIPECPVSTFVLDVAMVDGRPVVVEFNPLHFGQIGLYASNPGKIAEALLNELDLI